MKLAAYQQQIRVDSLEKLESSPKKIQAELRERALAGIRSAGELGVRAICLQELCDLPYFPASNQPRWRELAEPLTENPFVRKIRAAARAFGMLIVLPVFEREGEQTFSSAIVIEEDGSVLGAVRKYPVGRGAGYFEKDFFGGEREPGYAVFEAKLGRIGVTLSRGGQFFKAAEKLAGELGVELIFNPRSQLTSLSQGVLEVELARHAREWGYGLLMANRVGSELWPIGEWSGGSLILDRNGVILSQASAIQDELIMARMGDSRIEVSARAGLRLLSQVQAKLQARLPATARVLLKKKKRPAPSSTETT